MCRFTLSIEYSKLFGGKTDGEIYGESKLNFYASLTVNSIVFIKNYFI